MRRAPIAFWFVVLGCAPTPADLDTVTIDATADVTSADDTVTCTTTWTPVGAAIVNATCTLQSPSGKQASCIATSPIGNDWSCDITIKAKSEAGVWTLVYVSANDGVGTPPYVVVPRSDTVTVTSTNADTTPPSITSFTIDSSAPDPSGTLNCNVVATDADSSIQYTGCTFSPSDGSASLSCIAPGGGICTINIPADKGGVTYSEANHFARDAVSNTTVQNNDLSFTVTVPSSCSGYAPSYLSSQEYPVDTQDAGSTETNVDIVAFLQAPEQIGNIIWGVSDVTPIASLNDFITGLSFFQGVMEAGYGTSWGCPDAPGGTCPAFVTGAWYRVEQIIDTVAGTYTMTVGLCDDTPTTFLTDRPLRSSAASVRYHGAISFNGTLGVTNVSWDQVPCSPETCVSLGNYTCDTWPDGCGGNINCDTGGQTCDERNAGDVCNAGTCCTPTPDCTGRVCGSVDDGCGGLASCGTCTGGDVCNVNGQCVAPAACAAYPTLPTIQTACTHYIATTGSDSNNGSSGSPWATIGHARQNAGNGAVICVRDGTYSGYTESAPPTLTTDQTLRPDSGANPTVGVLRFDYSSQQAAHLVVAELNIRRPSGSAGSLVYANNVTDLRLHGNEISSYKPMVAGSGEVCIEAVNSNGLIFDRNHCFSTHRGISYENCPDMQVIGNHLECTAGSGIRSNFDSPRGIVAYNNVVGVDYVPDADSVPSPHSSMMTMRSFNNGEIRNNIFRGFGSTSGLKFYTNQGPDQESYDNNLIENNLVYNQENLFIAQFAGMGSGNVFRNNTFYPGILQEPGGAPYTCADERDPNHRTVGMIFNASGSAGSAEFFNNIIAGEFDVPSAVIAAEGKNLLKVWFDGTSWVSTSAGGSQTYWTGGSSCNDSHFENGVVFTDSFTFGNASAGKLEMLPDRYAEKDFTLAVGSPAINFGDSTKQPAGSLGTVVNGFIQDDGTCRDATHHDAGAYQTP